LWGVDVEVRGEENLLAVEINSFWSLFTDESSSAVEFREGGGEE